MLSNIYLCTLDLGWLSIGLFLIQSKILDLWRSLVFYLYWIIYWYVIQRSFLNQLSRIIQGYSKGLTVWSEQIHPPTWSSQLCHTDQSRTRDEHPHQDGTRPSVDWDDRELQLWKFCLNIKNDIHICRQTQTHNYYTVPVPVRWWSPQGQHIYSDSIFCCPPMFYSQWRGSNTWSWSPSNLQDIAERTHNHSALEDEMNKRHIKD